MKRATSPRQDVSRVVILYSATAREFAGASPSGKGRCRRSIVLSRTPLNLLILVGLGWSAAGGRARLGARADRAGVASRRCGPPGQLSLHVAPIRCRCSSRPRRARGKRRCARAGAVAQRGRQRPVRQSCRRATTRGQIAIVAGARTRLGLGSAWPALLVGLGIAAMNATRPARLEASRREKRGRMTGTAGRGAEPPAYLSDRAPSTASRARGCPCLDGTPTRWRRTSPPPCECGRNPRREVRLGLALISTMRAFCGPWPGHRPRGSATSGSPPFRATVQSGGVSDGSPTPSRSPRSSSPVFAISNPLRETSTHAPAPVRPAPRAAQVRLPEGMRTAECEPS